MNRLDNPPAFPRPASRGNNYLTGEEDVVVDPQKGMTLLDYFAAQAVRGLTAEYIIPSQEAAQWAYEIAQQMIDVRRTFLS